MTPDWKEGGIRLDSERQTEALGRALAGVLVAEDVLLLFGGLGAGKTVFARAVIRALAGDTTLEVPSPTYTLVQVYDTALGPVHHYDLYRLEDPAECAGLGVEDAFGRELAIVEWPERLGVYAPPDPIQVELASAGEEEDARLARLSAPGRLGQRLRGVLEGLS